jgi:hypothetical protein
MHRGMMRLINFEGACRRGDTQSNAVELAELCAAELPREVVTPARALAKMITLCA